MVLPFKGILYDAMSFAHGQVPNSTGRRVHCADFEMNYVECMEAYGLIRGTTKCLKYREDYDECKSDNLKNARALLIKYERYKKVAKGEISFKERRGEPVPYDAYVSGTFWP